MNEVKKQNSINLIIVITLTSLLEIAYGYFHIETSDKGYILIWETVAFLTLQVIVLLTLKLTKALSKQPVLDIYIGVSGLVHSVFMALLVAQCISTNIETFFFVSGIFIIFDIVLLLLWELICRRNKKKEHTTPKTFGRKQRTIITIFSFIGAFTGVFLVSKLNHSIIVSDVLFSLLSLTYTVFYFSLKTKKDNQ